MAAFQAMLRNVHTTVDLSLLISADIATFPGDPDPLIERLSTIKEGGANTTRIILGAHTGTHVDVPYHLLARGKTVDELPLETFCGSALTYDLTECVLGSRISPDDLKNAIPLKTGEIALFYTGSNALAASGRTNRPYTCLDITMADWLIQKQAKAVGIDSMSVDPLDSLKRSAQEATTEWNRHFRELVGQPSTLEGAASVVSWCAVATEAGRCFSYTRVRACLAALASSPRSSRRLLTHAA